VQLGRRILPTQMSNCSGSTTPLFLHRAPELQLVRAECERDHLLRRNPRLTRSNPFGCLTGREALPALVNVQLQDRLRLVAVNILAGSLSHYEFCS
jgi:hypothetical protein